MPGGSAVTVVNSVRLDMTMNGRVLDAGSIVHSNDDKQEGY